ncbi:MAG: hypothetical protein H6585_14255 [Flavobacteriales bacterium]|nr:hypothetical protein [Flavobacteriales bacterium]MCB9449493.1 hypothetical protein [Flavobacteriales bacterium]
MKRSIIGIIILTLFSLPSMAGVIVLTGSYQGKNLYVQNPFAGSGIGFCTFEVTVNGEIATDELNANAFEIDFSNYQLELGAPVEVKIKHKDDCKPKVLNPEVLKPRSTFEIISIKVESNGDDGILKWQTRNESGSLTYVVEQFKWNKWVRVGEVEGKGSATPNDYSFDVTTHSGVNKFRVKQTDFSGRPRYSTPANFNSKKPEITFTPVKVKDMIDFSGETMYEIYDSYGNIVKKGKGNKVEVTNLEKGIYYLSYDNKTEQFMKK